MSFAKLMSTFAIVLSVAGALSACSSVPKAAPEQAPPPASDKGDDAPVTENNPL